MNLAFGLGNQGVYAIGARSAPPGNGLWGDVMSVGLEPYINLVGIKPH